MFKIIKIYFVILMSYMAGWLIMPRVIEVFQQYQDKKRFYVMVAAALLLLFMFVAFAVGPDNPEVPVE